MKLSLHCTTKSYTHLPTNCEIILLYIARSKLRGETTEISFRVWHKCICVCYLQIYHVGKNLQHLSQRSRTFQI